MNSPLFGPEARQCAMTVLGRLSQRRETQRAALVGPTLRARLPELLDAALDATLETDEGIGRLLAVAVRDRGSLDLANRVLARCGDGRMRNAVALREVALEATRICVETDRADNPEPSDQMLEQCASLLNDFGVRLLDVGQPAEAEQALRSAIAIRQGLVDQEPTALHGLATCWHNLGDVLLELGKVAEARSATEEAVHHRRDLELDEGTRGRYDLSVSLLHLSEIEHRLGRPKKALEASRSATALLERLAQENGRYRAEFAAALGANARDLDNNGEIAAATRQLEQAIVIRTTLAREDPTVHQFNLSNTLLDRGALASRQADTEQAIRSIEQAVDIRRQLAAEHANFTPALAQAFDHLAIALTRSGRPHEARTAANKAVTRYQSVAESNPGFEAALARSLMNKSAIEFALGALGNATEDIERSVRLLRRVAEAEPKATAKRLGRALRDWSAILAAGHHFHQAAEMAEQAADLLRPLAQEQPLAYRFDYVHALNALGIRYADLDRDIAALEAHREALTLIRTTDSEDLEWLEAEAMCLNNLSTVLEAVDDLEEAYTTAKNAVVLLCRLAERLAETYSLQYATGLRNVAKLAALLDRRSEALEAAQTMLGICEAAYARAPEISRGQLADALGFLAELRAEAGDHHEAIRYATAGISHLECLTEPSTKIDLARALANLGQLQTGVNPAAARQALHEAHKRYRALVRRANTVPHNEVLAGLSAVANRLSKLGDEEAGLRAYQTAIDHAQWLTEEYPNDGLPLFFDLSFERAGALVAAGREDEAIDDLEETMKKLAELQRRRPDIARRTAFSCLLRVQSTADLVQSDDNCMRLNRIVLAFQPLIGNPGPEKD